MNRDVLQGKWKQIRGKVKEEWGHIADHDLDKISGKREQLAGPVHVKYGYTKEKVEQVVNHMLRRLNLCPSHGNPDSTVFPVFAGSRLTLVVFQVLARRQRASV